MADLRYYDIIDKPVITEKSMAGMEYKRYTFYVHTEATKSQVKRGSRKDVPWNQSCESKHHEFGW